jgi:N utilization substance protein A
MKSDFMLAINQLCAERKLPREVVMEAVEAALISAYKRNFGAAANIEVQVDPNSGEARVFALKEVTDSVQDQKAQISLTEAQQMSPGIELGQTVLIESTPRDFGRIAAQTAKQVILQRIREAERDVLFSSFADSAGEIAHGTIQSLDYHSGDVIVSLEGGAEAVLPAREQVPAERYRRGSRLRAYVVDVRRGNRGPQITLSRRSSAFLRRLLELEVPEIFNGSVEIKAIAREAGSRSKVAVYATQEGVDPVGSCVGVRGGRIQNVVNELGGEKIDVVQWDPDVATFIANALSPAKVMNVLPDDSPESGKTGVVIVPDRQLSLAIGKEGQNARLAAKLTGWRIDIKSASEAAEETLGRLEEAEIAPEDMDLLSLAEALLRKRDMESLSDEERSLISVGMGEAQQEKLVPATPEPVTAAEAEAQAEVAGGETEPVEPPVEAVEEAVEPEASAAEEPAEMVVEAEAGAGPQEEAEVADEAALEPPFEGEPIEDSLGWVVTEPEEDLFGGWPATEEEVPDWQDWESEKLWEEEELPKEGKKKKKKRKSKPTFALGNDDVDALDRPGGKPSRSRGW